MKIKKYTGNTAHDAMLKLKAELGPDAIVLNTRTVRNKGFFGFLKKPLIEITVGYEEDDLLSNGVKKDYEDKLNDIGKEISELKSIIRSQSSLSHDSELPPILHRYHNQMVDNGLDPELSKNILGEIQEQIDINKKDKETIENIIKYILTEKLGRPQALTMDEKNKKIFFVGPTGVGKTTTLAKIAASLVLKNEYKIGLVTADTYRVGAVEQLRIYSEILQLPLEIAYNSADINKAFEKYKDMDIILIDTAGRNHNDDGQIEDLKEILDSTESKDVYLLVNANMDYKNLDSLIERYNFLDDYKLIITKVDEAINYGNIINIKDMTKGELTYWTTGQNVPDDISIIQIEEIVNNIVKEKTND